MTKKAFTLLELIVVILIIGILGTFGFVQYTQMLEKGRAAEAYTNLGMLRKLQIAYKLEYGSYGDISLVSNAGLPIDYGAGGWGNCSNTSFYFGYVCEGSDYCHAFRCISGGKKPDAASSYSIHINLENGTFLE